MTKQKPEEKKLEKRTIEIVFQNGEVAVAEYEIEEMADDYIWEDFRNGSQENQLWYPQDWADFELKICGHQVNEIDMRKVIGAKYN